MGRGRDRHRAEQRFGVFAVASAVMASGVAERANAVELRTGDEANAAMAIGAQYLPPGAL